MESIRIDLNNYVSKIEMAEGQTLFGDIIKRSCENIFQRVLDDYPILKEYFVLETSNYGGDISRQTEFQVISFRFVNNNNMGFRYIIPYPYNDSSTITTRSVENTDNINTNMMPRGQIYNYATNTSYNITGASWFRPSNNMRNWVNEENGKKYYNFYLNNYIELNTFDNGDIAISNGIQGNDGDCRILFTKDIEGRTVIITPAESNVTNPYGNYTYLYCFILKDGVDSVPINYIRPRGAWGATDNLADIGNVAILQNNIANATNKIIDILQPSVISVINDSIGKSPLKINNSNVILVDGKKYTQVIFDLFIEEE